MMEARVGDLCCYQSGFGSVVPEHPADCYRHGTLGAHRKHGKYGVED